MISRKNRFHGHNSLNYLFRRGRTVRTELMSLRFTASNREDYRLAVIVSRKVSKSAVVRNRIRRRLYEVVRNLRQDAAKPWQFDIAITVYDERLATLPHSELVQLVKKLFQKANIT